MSVFTLVLYGISLGLGAGLLLLALPLRRRFGGEDFSPFFSYLAAFTVSGFLNLFGRSLAVSLLHASTPQSQVTIDLIFGFLIFPFMLAALYFFILFIGALWRSAVSAKLKRGYAVFAAAAILVLIIVTARYLDARLVEPAARVLGVINAGILLAYVIVSGWGLAGTWAIEDPRLYKIYQKLCVRSRFQVVAMVREGKNGSLENGGDEPLNS